jgi:membrane protease YdiL (CAAX protease family)
MNAPNHANPPKSANSLKSLNFFFNQTGRLRSGWRFLIFQLLFVAFGSLFGAVISFLMANLSVVYERGSVLSFVVPNFILLTLSLIFGWLCGKFLEGLAFRALGAWFVKNWWKDLIFGLLVGAASISFAVLIAVIFGGMRLQSNETAGTTAIGLTLGVSLFVFILGAAAEEAYFRGYILQTFTRAKLVPVGVLITSLFFASAHLNNPNSEKISASNTILAGVLFAVAYLKTRNLWFPFGIHLMWNWMQGAVFGSPVSGITKLTTAPIFEQTDKGVELFTGGDYGIEGGIACTIAIIVSGIFVWFSPFFKPTAEMLKLTSEENPAIKYNHSKNV